MDLTPSLTKYLVFISTKQKQVLYSADRPNSIFPTKKETRGKKTVLVSSQKPVWQNIVFEIPTRPISDALDWIGGGYSCDLNLISINKDGRIVEEWFIKDAKVVSHLTMKGREINTGVIRVIVSHSWAQRVRRNAL